MNKYQLRKRIEDELAVFFATQTADTMARTVMKSYLMYGHKQVRIPLEGFHPLAGVYEEHADIGVIVITMPG